MIHNFFSVLLISKTPDILKKVPEMLNPEGIRTDIASSGNQSLEMLHTVGYDLILTDGSISDTAFSDVFQKIRTFFPEIPVIFLMKKEEESDLKMIISSKGNDKSGKFPILSVPSEGETPFLFKENLLFLIDQILRVQNLGKEKKISDNNFAELISFLPDATFIIDTQGIVRAWNPAMEKLTQIPSVEMIGKGDYSYSLPLYGKRRPILIDLVLDHNPEKMREYPFIHTDGARMISEDFLPHFNQGKGAHLCFYASPMYDQNGNIVGAIESIRNLSEDGLKYGIKKLEFNFSELYKSHRSDETFPAELLKEKQLPEKEYRVHECLSKEKKHILPFPQGDEEPFWIEDFSEVKKFLNVLKTAGIEDLRTFFDEHPQELIRCRMLISISEVHPRCLSFFGVKTNEEFIQGLPTFFTTESLSIFREELVAIDRGDASFESEDTVIDANGIKKTIIIRLIPLPGYEESLERVLVSCSDITDYIRIEKDLRDSLNFLEKFASYANAPIIAWDPDCRITLFNNVFSQITGYSSHDIIGKNIDILFPEYLREESSVHVREALAGKRWKSLLLTIRQKSSDIRTILWNSSNIINSSGEIVMTFAQGKDITEQKLALDYMNRYISELVDKNIELDDTKCKLEEINTSLDKKVEVRTQEIEKILRQKDEFIAQIGHDLKTPLTPILSILPVLRKKEEDPKKIEYLEMAIRNARHMHELLKNILHMARLNREYLPSPGTILHIHQMIEEVVVNLEYEILKKRIIVHNQIPDDLTLKISPLDFDTIFENLVDNAIKYSYPGGVISLDGEQNENEIMIHISDTGIGLLPEESDRIFDEFYKADTSRHDGKSYGLGLSITQKIIERNGGSISAKSEGRGKGTKFTITFPLHKGYYRP